MEEDAPRWVRWWFRAAALYGLVVLAPLYLVPAPGAAAIMAHYGFAGVALAFQLVFWIIGGDPVRHRPLMLAGVAEKAALIVPCAVMAQAGGIPVAVLAAVGIDLLLGAGFLLAWRATPPA